MPREGENLTPETEKSGESKMSVEDIETCIKEALKGGFHEDASPALYDLDIGQFRKDFSKKYNIHFDEVPKIVEKYIKENPSRVEELRAEIKKLKEKGY